MTEAIITKASALDDTHLELDKALPEGFGRRMLVRVTPVPTEPGHLLRELEAAYLTMSEQERQAEVALAEEGLRAQPDLAKAFSKETEWPWWE